MIKRGDTRIWQGPRKSIVEDLVRASLPSYCPSDKNTSIWNRFLREATYIISYRFLCEATGAMSMD